VIICLTRAICVLFSIPNQVLKLHKKLSVGLPIGIQPTCTSRSVKKIRHSHKKLGERIEFVIQKRVDLNLITERIVLGNQSKVPFARKIKPPGHAINHPFAYIFRAKTLRVRLLQYLQNIKLLIRNIVRFQKIFNYSESYIQTIAERRGRFGRVAEAIARHPDKLGIGLGEDTGLIITEGNICKIIGSGMLILFDGSNLSHNRYESLKDNVCISLANLTVNILATQDTYYLSERRAEICYTPENHKKEVSKLQ